MVAEAAGGRRFAQGSRGTPPARPCSCALSGDAPSTPLSTPASGRAGPEQATPLCHLRANRDAPSPEATPRAGAQGAGGARAAWRWGPGGGRSEAGPRALLRPPGGLLPGAGTGSPRRGRTPLGTPRARLLAAARSSASGAPWRRAPRVWAPEVPKPSPPPAWGGGGNFLGRLAPRKERGIDEGPYTFRGRIRGNEHLHVAAGSVKCHSLFCRAIWHHLAKGIRSFT